MIQSCKNFNSGVWWGCQMDRVSDAGSKSGLGCHVMDLKGAGQWWSVGKKCIS